MNKHSLTSIIFCSVILICLGQFLCGSAAFGLTLMGPPRSLLQEGQSAISLEYNYNKMNLEAFGNFTEIDEVSGLQTTTPSYTKYKIESFKSSMVSARLDTNIFENWDLFVRIGTSDGKGEIKEEQPGGTSGQEFNDFDGNFGFSWGVGTRTTFYKEDNISWGGTFQVNWTNPGKSDITDDTDSSFTGTAEIKYWEFQVGIGPTLEYNDIRIYCGPFLHFIKGDFNLTGTTVSSPATITYDASQDIREKSQVGGFLGAQWKINNNSSLITEGQFTDNGWGIGVSATWKF